MIISINGKLRTGKGVMLTFLSLLFSHFGYNVFANYHIKTNNFQHLTFLDYVLLLDKGRCAVPSVITIDELQGWFDSRSSMSKANKYGTYMLFQSAKLGYHVFYSSQINKRADIDYRYMSDYRLRSSKDLDHRCFVYELLDTDYPDEDIPTGQKLTIPFSVASSWWNMYDTFEAVKPVGFDAFVSDLKRRM